MFKTGAMPILASAAIALSLGACQGMGGGEAGRQQSSATQAPSASGQASSGQAGQQAQAVSPDLVRNVQRTLSQRGYPTGPADGIYGESTQQALRNFQRDQRLNSTGQLDGQTLAALGVVTDGARATGSAYTPTSRRGSSRQPANAANLSSNQVRDLQQELSSRGYDSGAVDGKWGSRTQQALRQFQQDQNLAANGQPDQRTMAALGMEGAGIQTGAAPAEPSDAQPREVEQEQSAAPEPQQPEPQQPEPQRADPPREETGQLPETQAPGTAAPSERTGANEGTEQEIPRATPGAELPGPEAP